MEQNTQSVLRLKGVRKFYPHGQTPLVVLNGIEFDVKRKETVAIVGPSGSGKTTLLGIMAGLDVPDEGEVSCLDTELANLSEDERARFRNRSVGFVFQNFQLIPTLNAIENVMVPLALRGEKKVHSKAVGLLEKVGLGARLDHYPIQLSGGEQQRVALARAFINEPEILFADEPTGNLDAETSEHITKLLFELNREKGTTLILVTHDLSLADRLDRKVSISKGKVCEL